MPKSHHTQSTTSMSAGERLPGTPDPMHRWPGHGGVTIAADSWGPRSGPLILLQHGGGQTRHAWKNAGEALGRAGYHAVAFDARGHGKSDSPREPSAYGRQQALDVVRILDALKINKAHIIGFSLGSRT